MPFHYCSVSQTGDVTLTLDPLVTMLNSTCGNLGFIMPSQRRKHRPSAAQQWDKGPAGYFFLRRYLTIATHALN